MKPLPVIQPPAAEAPAPTNETAALVAHPAKTEELKPRILDAIRTIYDPEIDIRHHRRCERRCRHPHDAHGAWLSGRAVAAG
jgi:hypothetical protein